ncbi:MAG: DUF4302 domain-containing protein [Pedobacter sp.]|uniref:DUF4302 domain-containing protein n=1 Tax=Pedobacter sp. TaxID=1411316 RepID=UPI002809DBB9|nr:DUF4302 domain-containing protein [Pedobacter sp.]MDQ8004633.1 DUF4302 domain-containing protein [Pedobacter sp.]
MKKNLIYAVILLLGFTACRKTEVEEAFYASSEKRMQDTLEFIRKQLTSAPHGWKGGLTTGLKGGFGFYFNFDADQNVDMLSDYSTASGNDVKKSTYRVSATNTAALLFDTYNYISLLQDPVPGVAGGTSGQGYRSDVEFIYTGHRGDSLFFKGKKYEHPFTLVKTSQIEKDAYLSGGINLYQTNFANVFNNNYSYAYYNDGSNENLAVEIDWTGKRVRFITVNSTGEATAIFASPFYYTASELSLVRKYYASYKGKAIKALKYEDNGILLMFTDGTTGKLASQTTPVYKFDLAFDYNKPFSRIVDGDAIPGVTATVHIFDQVKSLFTTSGRTITSQYFQIRNNTTAVFYIAYYSGTPPDHSSFTASATYEITKRTGDRIWLKRTAIDANFNTRATQVAPVNNFFGTGSEREFVLAWATSSNASVKFPIGAIKLATNLNNMLYGRLGE